MSNGHHFSDLILQTIRIQLTGDSTQQFSEEQQAVVVEAMAAALAVVDSSLSSAWTVHAISGDALHYELTPLPNNAISFETAWEIVVALRNQPQITKAEPLFI